MVENKNALVNQETSVEYKNDHINVSVSRSPGSIIKFIIKVAAEAVEAAYTKAIKAVNKEISLPGFRKGKAPETLVVKKYDKQIQEEWRQIVLQTAFSEALQLTNLKPFHQQTIRCTDFKELNRKAPTEVVVEFEASPSIPTIDLKDLSIPKIELPPISQTDIDQVLKNLRLYHASWNDVTDRAVKDGDYVDLDVDNLDEEGHNICRNTRFEVTKGIMANWMRDLLIGVKTGESVEGVSQKESPDGEEEEGAGEFKPTRCRMTVNAIKSPVLPEMDEQFFKRIGAVSLEDLEGKIKADLQNRAKEKILGEQRRILDKALLEKYVFDVPASLVNQEIDQRLAGHIQWLESQKLPTEAHNKQIEDLQEKLPAEVEKGCRLLFLLLGFAKVHNLEVSQDEVISELSQQFAYGQGNLAGMNDPDALRARISQSLILRKAKDFILNHLEGVKK